MKYIIIDWENHEYHTIESKEEIKNYFEKIAEEFHPSDIDYFEELMNKHIIVSAKTSKEVSFKAEPKAVFNVDFSLGE